MKKRNFTDEQIKDIANQETTFYHLFTTVDDRATYRKYRREIRNEYQGRLQKLRTDENYIKYRNNQLERILNTGAVIKEVSKNWNSVSPYFWERYDIAALAIIEKMDRLHLEGEPIENYANTYWMKVAHTKLKTELRKTIRRKSKEILYSTNPDTILDRKFILL